MSNPRKLALASLIKAELSSTYSNLEVNSVLSKEAMKKEDMALYTALYLGVTERIITLDYLISRYSSMPLEKLEVDTKNALRMGFYQLLYMDKIPDYSAVSETVSLCPRRSKGFVNACLRSFIRDEKELPLPEGEWESVSISCSLPMHIIEIFRSSYGDEEAKKIAQALSKTRKGLTLRVNTLKIEPVEFRKLLKKHKISHTPVELFEEAVIVNAPISDIIDFIDKGLCFVQDVASISCVKILLPESKCNVLDACACPGGKTFSSAIYMKNEGKIIACDLHKNKLPLITKGADKLGITIIEAREQNAKLLNEEFVDGFDRVLCDVPCSGLGIISKKPDIKHKTLEQINSLPEIQLEILENCAKYASVGATLVYSTCTLNKNENEGVVKAFLQKNTNFAPVDFELDEIKSSDGMYTFMPHKMDSDGFFVAKMKRNS